MSLVFQPIKINEHITLKNRIIMSPMCQYSAINGLPNSWHFVHYATRAIGGVAAIVVEATAVSPEGRISYGDLGLWNEEQKEAFMQLTSELKRYNCVPAIQLAHAGRKASCGKPWVNYHQIAPDQSNGWQTVSSSDIPFLPDDVSPISLTIEEINSVIEDFKQSTIRAVEAGFEIIEIHAAHGYLIHQFYSPLINNRVDEYGGSFDNRIRFLMEIIDAVQSVLSTQSLWVRISATDWAEGGWNLEESILLAERLAEKGVDVIDVSTGGGVAHQKIKVEKEYQTPYATSIKNKTNILVGTVGLIESGVEADAILQAEKADLIFIGREFLRNPYFVLDAAKELNVAVKWPSPYERSKK